MKKTLFSLLIIIFSITVFPHAIFAQAPANSPVTIPDTNLRTRITEALGKPSDAQLTVNDMLALTLLDGQDANIQDLTGLEHAHNLKELWISAAMSVTDISVRLQG